MTLRNYRKGCCCQDMTGHGTKQGGIIPDKAVEGGVLYSVFAQDSSRHDTGTRISPATAVRAVQGSNAAAVDTWLIEVCSISRVGGPSGRPNSQNTVGWRTSVCVRYGRRQCRICICCIKCGTGMSLFWAAQCFSCMGKSLCVTQRRNITGTVKSSSSRPKGQSGEVGVAPPVNGTSPERVPEAFKTPSANSALVHVRTSNGESQRTRDFQN